MFNRCAKLRAVSSTVERYGEPLVLLAIRLWMSYSFFTAGMSKLDNYLRGEWTSTVYIFQNIYPLPGVPAEIIAPIWTGMELVFPVLLVAGIASRLSASVLLVLTGLMEISSRLIDPDYVAHDTIMWALLLAVIVVRGGGILSIDYAVCGRKNKDAL